MISFNLSCNDYHAILGKLDDELKRIENQIQYRKIELLGPQKSRNINFCEMNNIFLNGTQTTISEDQRILDHDLTLQRLYDRQKRVKSNREFIYNNAEFPIPDMTEDDLYK